VETMVALLVFSITVAITVGIFARATQIQRQAFDAQRVVENMIFTIEPGIYMQNKFGIRIEDTVLMEKYAKPLTKTTKELLVFIKQ